MSTDNPISNEHPPLGGSHPVVSSGAQDLPRIDSPHAPKFRMVLGLLGVIAVVAIALAVVVASNSSSRGSTVGTANWSSWSPDSSSSAGVSEIAQYVAPYYRVSSAQQLDEITPIKLSQTSAAGTTTGSGLTVAVNQGTSKSQSLGLLNGKTVAYDVCGLGAKNCELSGTASTNRMLLLRREGLELALYTLEYISDSQNVVIVLPPGHTVTSGGSAEKGVTVALLFDRRELQPLLNVKLSNSLGTYPPELSSLSLWSKTEEAGLVDQITAHGLFTSQVETLQVGGSALVLTALPAQ